MILQSRRFRPDGFIRPGDKARRILVPISHPDAPTHERIHHDLVLAQPIVAGPNNRRAVNIWSNTHSCATAKGTKRLHAERDKSRSNRCDVMNLKRYDHPETGAIAGRRQPRSPLAQRQSCDRRRRDNARTLVGTDMFRRAWFQQSDRPVSPGSSEKLSVRENRTRKVAALKQPTGLSDRSPDTSYLLYENVYLGRARDKDLHFGHSQFARRSLDLSILDANYSWHNGS